MPRCQQPEFVGHAYETAAGVLVESSALTTRDLDLLFDARKRVAFLTGVRQGEDQPLIKVLQKAVPSFGVMRDQPQTAVNDDSFEIDIIRRASRDGDPHPMRMSDDEDDFWAAQRRKPPKGRRSSVAAGSSIWWWV